MQRDSSVVGTAPSRADMCPIYDFERTLAHHALPSARAHAGAAEHLSGGDAEMTGEDGGDHRGEVWHGTLLRDDC